MIYGSHVRVTDFVIALKFWLQATTQ